jgi:TadE-like protein
MERTIHQRRLARKAFLTMELALTLPVFLVVLFALFEFSLLFAARSSVVQASRVGARTATLQGVDAGQIDFTVRSILRPRLRNSAQIAIEAGQRSGDPVTVAVTVPMSAAAPNLLWPIGYDLTGRQFSVATRMVKE